MLLEKWPAGQPASLGVRSLLPLDCVRRRYVHVLVRYCFPMRRNLKRYYGAGDLHFITCSCYRRQPLFGTARRRDLLLTVLEQMRKRYQFVVAGYVIMPEHIHLLISEPQKKNPSTVMQALKLGFARRVLAQARRRRNLSQASLFDHAPQHIWQKRFRHSNYDFNVSTERKRMRNCATCIATR